MCIRDRGYEDESSDDEADAPNEEAKAIREDRYSQPLEIDLEIVKKKAAEILGVPVEKLPVAKAAAAAAQLAA